jgi:hypothetical protein
MEAEVFGIAKLIETLQGLPDELREKAEKATNASVIEGLQVARQLSPVKTGYFKSRWHVQAQGGTRERIFTELVNDAPYAVPLIFGHRTASGSHVAPRDCLTPAILRSRQQLTRRLAAIRLTGRR